jgi:hypothetical protein
MAAAVAAVAVENKTVDACAFLRDDRRTGARRVRYMRGDARMRRLFDSVS